MKIPSAYTRRKARIEIIPLIDIVFFLLATFVMVSLSMIKNNGIPVNLPEAGTAQKQEQKKSAIALTVTDQNFIYVDKEKVSLSDLPSRLKKLKKSDPDLQIVIHGDKQALFGTAVQVLDEVRQQGIAKVAIQTSSKSAS